MKARTCFLIPLTAIFVLILLLGTNAHAAGGTLDLTFGTNGVVSTQFNSLPSSASDIALQPDGKILVLGDAQSAKVLARYNGSGGVDSSFGVGGVAPVDIPSFSGVRVAILSDGKIIVGGGSGGRFAVARYTANGSLDTSFGTGGLAVLPAEVGDSRYAPSDLVIQPDGMIVMVGMESNQGNFTNVAVARFNSDGAPDFMRIFDKYDFPNNRYNGASAVAVQPDNKIVVSGDMMDNDANQQLTLLRLTQDGWTDKSAFGTNGKGTVQVSIPNFSHSSGALALQPDGKIVAAGSIVNDDNKPVDGVLVRLLGDGSLDTSFGGTGIIIADFGANEAFDDFVIQPDGKIIVEGKTASLDASDFLLVRYNSDGSLDTTFGTNGKVVTDLGNSADTAMGIARQLDSRVVVIGSSGANAILARYETGAAGVTNTASFKSVGVYDGWLLESGENTNKGGTLDKNSNAIFVGDGTKDRQYRGFLSFDTASLPDDAVVTAAQVKVKRQGIVGTDPFITHGSLLLEIRNGTFSNNVALGLEDFAAIANIGSTQDPFSGAVDNWHTASLSGVNLSHVNKHGTTQFRLMFAKDDNDDMGADYVKFFSGNSTSAQPELVVTYSTSGATENRAPVINGGAAISVSLAENTMTVAGVTATDPDGQQITYSISGADAGRFSINSSTGVLTFVTPPDFETIPSGTVYHVTAQASDGTLTSTQDIAVTVTPVNEFAPLVTSETNISLPEGAIDVTTVIATDADLPAPTLEYILAGGDDWQLFNLDPSSGRLSFITPPSYNAPNDAGLDHVYNVRIEASDGEQGTSQDLVISILDPNVPTGEMLDTSFGANGVVTMEFDNQPSSVLGLALQSDGKIILLGIAKASADGGDFTYRKFLSRYNPNGSLDTSFGTNGIAPIEIEYFSASTIELQADGKIIVASGGGWISAVRFNNNGSLDTSFGMSGVARMDIYEHNGSIRDVAIQPDGKIVLTGDHTQGQANYTEFFIARFTSNGQADTSFVANGFNIIDNLPNYRYAYGEAVAIQTDGKIVMSGNMTDNDGKSNLALVRLNPDGSFDKAGFGTNGRGNIVTPISNFQTGDGALAIQADGKIVAFGDANDNLVLVRYNTNGTLDTTFGGTGIVSADTGQVDEASDLALQADGKIIVCGTIWNTNSKDILLMRFNPDGSLDTSFGANGMSVTNIGINNDEGGGIIQQPDGKIIISGASGDNALMARYDVGAPDATTTLSFKSIGLHDGWILESGENSSQGSSLEKVSNALFVGDDARDRQYRSVLSFDTNSIPDDAALTSAQLKIRKQGIVGSDPFDTHGDLLLEIRSGTFSNTVALNVEDFSAIANIGSTQDKFVETDGDWCVADLSGTNLGLVNKYGFTQFRLRFSMDDNDDLGADYDRFFSGNAAGDQPELVIHYTTSNSLMSAMAASFALAKVQALTPEPVNTPPAFTSAASFSVEENTPAVGILSAGDMDSPVQVLSYAAIGGADSALFAVNPTTGDLTFVSPPDFEQPKDFGADNVYNLTLQVSDGTLTATQEVSVTVMGVNDNAPLISSSGTISIAENSSAVTLLTAADADFPAQALSYAAIGGADSALFAVNPTTGDLTFVSPPDFEQPKDAGADNVYNLTVQVSDGTFNTTQDMTVTVTAVNDNTPAFTSPAGLSVAENSMTIATLTTADADLPTQALTYSVIGGADAAYFNFNSTTGALSFIAVHDYELPNDSNKDNIYNLVIQVSDGTLTAAQEISVTVLPVNDNTPVITTPDKISVSENVLTVAIITTTDADRPAQILTYAITGGADAAKFSIVNATGELKFITAPDFETPADANRDNAYEVTVQVSDGVSNVTKNISVQVTDKAD